MRLVRRRSLVRAITLVGVAAIITLARSTSSAHTNTTQVTWAVDVAPIVRERCAGCHRANGFGPMPLTTYDEAKRWAATIRDEVLSGRMPPWFAAPGFGNFSNDASLTPVEIEMLARWANGGAPAGPDSVATPSAAANGARTSALRVQFPSVNVAGASTERFELPLDLKGDRWVTGWEFQPGNATVVEHASIAVAARVAAFGRRAVQKNSGAADRSKLAHVVSRRAAFTRASPPIARVRRRANRQYHQHRRGEPARVRGGRISGSRRSSS